MTRKEVFINGEESQGLRRRQEEVADAQLPARDEEGKFVSGHERMGGRTKSPLPKNMSRKTKDLILQQIEPYLYRIGADLKMMVEPRERIDAITKLLPYILPKMQSIEVDQLTNRNMGAEEQLREMNETMTKHLEEQKEMLKKLVK